MENNKSTTTSFSTLTQQLQSGKIDAASFQKRYSDLLNFEMEQDPKEPQPKKQRKMVTSKVLF